MRSANRSSFVTILLSVLCMWADVGHAQNSTCTLSSTESVAERGGILHLRLELQSPAAILQVLGMDTLGSVREIAVNRTGNIEVRNFEVTVDNRALLGHASLQAIVLLDDGSKCTSRRLEISLDVGSSISELEISGLTQPLTFIGELRRVTVNAKGSDGKQFSLNDSGRLSVTSADPSIAAVKERPMTVLAVNEGSTSITAHYSDPSRSIQLSVSAPVTVKPGREGDLNNDGLVNLDDYNEIYSVLERGEGIWPVTSPDARDLDGNMAINGNDLVLLARLCDFENCNYGKLATGEPPPTPIPAATWTVLPTTTPTPTWTPTPPSTPTSNGSSDAN